MPSRRSLVLAALAILAGLGLLVGLPYLSPKSGVQRAFGDLIEAVEDNDGEALAALLADNYADGFGHDREGLRRLVVSARRHFFVLTIRRDQSELVLATDKRSATTRARLRLDGNGTALAQAAIRASAEHDTPTEFRWRRASWKPWDWRLVSIDNPEAARALARFERETGGLGL